MHTQEIDYTYQILPEPIELIIMALCSDYLRRHSVIEKSSSTYRIIMEYRFLNYRIYNAAVEIVGTRYALHFIDDIGRGTGYAKNQHIHLSERIYKMRKTQVKINIAKRLSLYE